MHRLFPVFAMAVIAASCEMSLADEDGLSPAIRRYIDSETSVVGWIDITQIDLAKLGEFSQDAFGQGIHDADKVEAIRAALAELDVTRVYWLSDISELQHGPNSLLLETDQAEAAARLISTLVSETGSVVERDGRIILVAMKPELLERLKTVTGAPSPNLVEAIARCESAPQGFVMQTPVVALTSVINQLQELVGNDPQQLASAAVALLSVQAVSISGELPPSTSKVVIATQSAENAEQLVEVVNSLADERLGDDASDVHLSTDGNLAVWEGNSLADADQALNSFRTLLNSPGPRDTVRSLKQIGLAQHNYHDVWSHFTPQALTDANGKRLLSWRVLILPYLEEAALYERFHLDEPWDSPHNLALVKEMPAVYASKGSPELEKEGRTRFLAPLTTDSVFGRKGTAVSIRDIIDGTSNTIMVLEAGPSHAVPWTKPEDLVVDVDGPMPSIVDNGSDGFFSCFCDGSVRHIPLTIDSAILNAVISMNGREVIPDF